MSAPLAPTGAAQHGVSALGMVNTSVNKWLLLAVLIAPWAIVPAWLTLGLWTYFADSVRPTHWTDLFPMFVPVFGVPIAYVFTVVVGLPIFLLLRRFCLQTLPVLLVVAVMAVAATLVALSEPGEPVLSSGEGLFYVYCAVCVAVTAWLFAVWVPKRRSNSSSSGRVAGVGTAAAGPPLNKA